MKLAIMWSSACSPFQGNHWDLPGRFRLVLSEKGVQLYYPGPQQLPLQTFRDDGRSLECLASDLDCDFGVSHQVAVPVRVGR